jgi:hypothetical protein
MTAAEGRIGSPTFLPGRTKTMCARERVRGLFAHPGRNLWG